VVPDVDAVPSMALGGTGSGAYAAVTTGGSGAAYSISSMGAVTALLVEPAPDVILGVAARAATLYYTAGTAGALDVSANTVGTSKTIVAAAAGTGPLAVDNDGVYWATASAIMRANLDGTSPKELTAATAAVDTIATDTLGTVYWTDQVGSVWHVGNGVTSTAAAKTLSVDSTGTPAYGVAADLSGNVYFARADSVYRVSFPTFQLTAVATSLGHPHGIALDPSSVNLYVADHGTPPNADGRIWKLSVP
jgi:streptogramin lyase